MKLLMISGDRSILAGKKGAFWYTLEEMARHWERIDVVCPRADARGVGERGSARSGPVQMHDGIFFHPSPRSLWSQSWWIQKKGKELIAQHHHDVMTIHEYPPFYNGGGGLSLSRRTGVPAVLEVHHVVGYPRAGSLTESIGRILSHIVLPREGIHAAGVRVVSLSVAETLKKWGMPAEKIHIVPSFYLNTGYVYPVPYAEKTYDVAFAGRLVANKGLIPLLEAIAQLSNTTLLIIGDGPLRRAAERHVRKLGIQNRVTFAQWLKLYQDVVDALRSARVVAVPSLSEGGPRIALEAMACGLPIVATHVGVLPEVIEDGRNGIFTTGEPHDLAQKIASLLVDPEKRKAIGKEAARIIDQFERTKLIREYAEFLQRIAQTHGRAHGSHSGAAPSTHTPHTHP